MGRTERMSMCFSCFYIEIPSEKKVLNALVAEYKATYGAEFYPKKEERLIIAADLESRMGIIADVSVAIEVQFTLIISTILLTSYCSI